MTGDSNIRENFYAAIKAEVRRQVAQRSLSGRTSEQQSMDEEEYLGSKGYPEKGRPTASFIRATMGMSKVALKRAQKRHLKLLQDYSAQRDRLRTEYRNLVKAGKLKPRGRVERYMVAARGHPDNQAVQAARRILAKQGLWDDQMSRKADERHEAVSTSSMGSIGKDTHNLILPTDYEKERRTERNDLWRMDQVKWKDYTSALRKPDGKPDLGRMSRAIKDREAQTEKQVLGVLRRGK